ncbi:SWM histone demethylase complex subunit phf2 [Dissostichus eleginoides]|uniref:SWM histone demethylase complex subunit phf2 n=1 Tax=Dissostichus eleginoides TaxID=100907 RepID=A0AAD9CKR0_DISEL|nr:SWM histone demethylase complex subunit phf2 [Dissostichus eleginoides]
MATKHNPDPNNPTSKEGKRMALELKHEHMLSEAKKAAEERKRACSVGDTLQSPKRGCVGRGKPRGRRGGRRQGSATVTSPPTEGFQSSSVEVLRTEPSAQHKFEKNMERLSDILSSSEASERWKEARPHHLQCLLEKEAVGHPLCGLCHEPAVIRECLPEEWFCGDCDVLHHKKQPLHNRDSLMNGFFKPISPTTCVVRVEGGYDTHDQACILPTVKAPNSSCKGTNFTGTRQTRRYDLHLPLYVCQTCQQQWTPDLKVLLKSGYWPASVSISTLYTLDLLSSFEELKVISPGFSRQAFAKLLEHRTKCGGRSGPVNGDALQRSFLEFSYASYEEDQLCRGTSKRLLEETASLEELKTELHCVSDDMVSTWISDVKEWASGTSETSGTSEDILQTALQQSIEGLYLSVRQRKQSLYRQNDSSKLRHRLRRKLADDKKRLNQEILKYNQLVHDSARGIDVAAVEHSLSGGSIMSALWPWEVHGMGIQEKILDQVMLTRRLQEEKGILLLEMAQHCTWLQNMAVALKNKVAEEGKSSGLSSPDTSEDEEGNII